MNLSKLGYTKKWIDFNFLDEETLSKQLADFEKGGDKGIEQYRYTSFQNWLEGKEKLTNIEVNNYVELANDDKDERMSGLAITDLFVSSKISNQQFDMIKLNLPEFGKWTFKLITREVLIRRIKNEELTSELFNLCYNYKKEYNDNRLLISIIKKTDNVEFLSLFAEIKIGKKIKTLASNKLNQLVKSEN